LTASAVGSLVSAMGLLCAYDLVDVALLLTGGASFYRDVHPIEGLIRAGWSLFKLPLLVLVLALAAGLRSTGSLRWQAAALLVCWMGYQGLLTWANDWPPYTNRFSAGTTHTRFVSEYLQREAVRRSSPLTVYWTADLRDVWFRAGVNSYYNWRQLSGCAFNRGTAVEGKRRSQVVRAFEMEYLGRSGHSPFWMAAYQRFYQLPEDARPTEQDLFRLCDEQGLDFAVLEHRFAGLFSATDGCFYIYDCRRLRARATGT
jgi:hypothetical protein